MIQAISVVDKDRHTERLVVVLGITDYGTLKIFFAIYDTLTNKFIEENDHEDGDLPRQAIRDVSQNLNINNVISITGIFDGSDIHIYYIKKS